MYQPHTHTLSLSLSRSLSLFNSSCDVCILKIFNQILYLNTRTLASVLAHKRKYSEKQLKVIKNL